MPKTKKGQRFLCDQLSSVTLPLTIEVGTYKVIPEKNHICAFCDMRMSFISSFIRLCTGNLRNHPFKNIQFKATDLFWLSELDMLSWLFNDKILGVARVIKNAWK